MENQARGEVKQLDELNRVRKLWAVLLAEANHLRRLGVFLLQASTRDEKLQLRAEVTWQPKLVHHAHLAQRGLHVPGDACTFGQARSFFEENNWNHCHGERVIGRTETERARAGFSMSPRGHSPCLAESFRPTNSTSMAALLPQKRHKRRAPRTTLLRMSSEGLER